MPDEGLIVEARGADLLAVKFTAMASPCEVLVPSMSQPTALAIGSVAAQEAWRIEKKFSRYRDDSVTARIHRNRGTSMEVDEETAALIDFSSQCFDLSEGLFDITSGVLRRVWRFDGSDRIPGIAEVDALLPLIGFEKLQWNPPRLLLPEGMELDFGGIGKEYAVDRAYELLAARNTIPFLVNSPRRRADACPSPAFHYTLYSKVSREKKTRPCARSAKQVLHDAARRRLCIR